MAATLPNTSFNNLNPHSSKTNYKMIQNNKTTEKMKTLYHTHTFLPNQCGSIITQKIDAPLSVVWSVVRKFDDPKTYKLFVKSCVLSSGDGGGGSVREVRVITGLPAVRSVERLDRLDDELHVMEFSIIGGDHKLVNYQSTVTLHEEDDDEEGIKLKGERTVVMESYVVDIPEDSCDKDTCLFADTVIGFNLKSLAKVAEKMVREENAPAGQIIYTT